MTAFYADTSVLLRRHVSEKGSHWFEELVESSASIATAELNLIEVYSAFNRLVREDRLSKRAYQELSIDLEELFEARYTRIPISNAILKIAREMLESHPLRAYDSIHLASALFANQGLIADGNAGLTFLSADHRLLAAATAEGLSAFDPSTVP